MALTQLLVIITATIQILLRRDKRKERKAVADALSETNSPLDSDIEYQNEHAKIKAISKV